MNQNFSNSSINSNCSRWNSAILRQYIVLFPSSRSLAIVLSYNEEVNLKVSLNSFLDSPFPLVEITISLPIVSQRLNICLHSRTFNNKRYKTHHKLMLCSSFHSSSDRWLEPAVFITKNKKRQQDIRTFYLLSPFSSRMGWSKARWSWFYPLLNFRPRTPDYTPGE